MWINVKLWQNINNIYWIKKFKTKIKSLALFICKLTTCVAQQSHLSWKVHTTMEEKVWYIHSLIAKITALIKKPASLFGGKIWKCLINSQNISMYLCNNLCLSIRQWVMYNNLYFPPPSFCVLWKHLKLGKI